MPAPGCARLRHVANSQNVICNAPLQRSQKERVAMRKVVRAIRSGIAILAASACGDPATRAEPVEVKDSAGVRIVVNGAPVSPSAWTAELEPTLEIGADETDTTQILFQVTGALVLSDDRIVVSLGTTPMLRWFDATGRFLNGTGRPGGGPGEFGPDRAWISDLWPLSGDSVATWEHNTRRMQVFDSNGRYARAVVLDVPPDLPISAYPQILGRLDNGFVSFVSPPSQLGPVGEVRRDSLRYVHYAADGTFTRELARLPGFTYFAMRWRLPDGRETKTEGRPPYARLPVAWASGSTFYYGSNDRYEVTLYDTAGDLKLLIRKPTPNRPVTPEAIQTYKDDAMARAPDDPSTRRQWEESINEAPYPDSLPAYRRLRADRDGMIWIQDYDLPGADTTAWSVFDATGRWVSELALPADWQIMDIGASYILVLVRDDLGVERVRRHHLSRR